jgi:hypothetical protein
MQYKEVQIKDLPEGYYRGQLEQLVQNQHTKVVVVAKEGYNNDWAAYIGWPQLHELKPQYQASGNYEYYCERVHRPQDVADRGDKFPENEARELFPDIKLRYRGV